MASKQIVIVGNGVAGLAAAQEARRADSNARIILIGNEGIPSYYRASLTEWITGDLNNDNILARTPSFYASLGIEQLEANVTRVDPKDAQIYFKDGRDMAYDALCIATGARANVIPIPGLAPENTLTYRTLADAIQIKDALEKSPKLIIVGGGVLGLELLGGLHRMGIQGVALIEYLGQIGRPILDKSVADWLMEKVSADGHQVFLNDTIKQVDAHIAELRSGKTLPCDLVVESVGVTPVFPEIPGLAIGKGIQVDEHGRTNLPGIFACGDCTETLSPISKKWAPTRVWRECAAQGRAAGAAMAGGEKPFHKKGFFNCSYIYDQDYAYIGDPHGEGTIFTHTTTNAYRKFRLVDGFLAGALLVNDRRGSTPIFNALGTELSKYGEALALPGFDWNTVTGLDWDLRFY